MVGFVYMKSRKLASAGYLLHMLHCQRKPSRNFAALPKASDEEYNRAVAKDRDVGSLLSLSVKPVVASSDTERARACPWHKIPEVEKGPCVDQHQPAWNMYKAAHLELLLHHSAPMAMTIRFCKSDLSGQSSRSCFPPLFCRCKAIGIILCANGSSLEYGCSIPVRCAVFLSTPKPSRGPGRCEHSCNTGVPLSQLNIHYEHQCIPKGYL